jgi:hypothetical protein
MSLLRLWRTFCVNYEARTESQPDEKKAKRKIENYKLKHSRFLTCYSALLICLQSSIATRPLHPMDTLEMISLTPTQRLDWLLEQPELVPAHASVQKLLAQYELFGGDKRSRG